MSLGHKSSSNSMKRGENMETLPTDVIIEILSRLPTKSIARFYCVSKLWESMLHRPYFTELFSTRSRAHPRILFALEQFNDWSFYSSPQPHDPYDKSSSSLVVDVDYQMKLPHLWNFGRRELSFGYASGLICFPDMVIYKEGFKNKPAIFNPSTGQYVILPEMITRCENSSSFLGFDPIDKQFKVLLLGYTYFGVNDHSVLTLGTAELRWRKIHCPLTHEPLSEVICINGVLYYFAEDIDETLAIVCFDVRSEQFKFIYPDCFRDPCMFYLIQDRGFKLINYKGKLGGFTWEVNEVDAMELSMWVREDAEKEEWSEHVYTLPHNKIVEKGFSVVGITARGEFFWAMQRIYKQFYVCYFNPERNTFQRVEIQGFENNLQEVYAIVDHVEDLNANDAKLFKSSICEE